MTFGTIVAVTELINAAIYMNNRDSTDDVVFSAQLMKKIAKVRDYDYDLCLGQWVGDQPSLFRTHSPRKGSNCDY